MTKSEEKMEKDIIQHIYAFESKRTGRNIFSFSLTIILLALLITISANLAYEILNEQQTLVLLQVFQEDIEIIKENFVNIIDTFWEESPQILLFLLFFFIMAFLTTLYFIAANFKKIKNRIISIKKFFNQPTKNG